MFITNYHIIIAKNNVFHLEEWRMLKSDPLLVSDFGTHTPLKAASWCSLSADSRGLFTYLPASSHPPQDLPSYHP